MCKLIWGEGIGRILGLFQEETLQKGCNIFPFFLHIIYQVLPCFFFFALSEVFVYIVANLK
jgi:hypothetical protein